MMCGSKGWIPAPGGAIVMECRGFDNVVLLEYAMGRLDEAENRRVRLHLAHCDDCRSVVAELNLWRR
jgi:anti-sigma factor RsiW